MSLTTIRPSAPLIPVSLEKAAIILLALGEDRSQRLLSELPDEELRLISRAMARLGRTSLEMVEQTVNEFRTEVGRSVNILGDTEGTERILLRIMPPEKVADILGGTKEADSTAVWEKLATLPPANLVGYLRNESPQTIAVILGRLPPEQAARVMSVLPDELTTDVALRMVRMDRIHQSVLTDIEETLHRELVGNATASDGPDSESVLAELLNRSDRDMVARLLASLEETEPDAAARVRRLMFTFDDLARIDPATFGVLIGETPVDKLAIALHSAVPAIRDLFLSTMSERAANMLRDEIESMAAPRRKAVEETQNDIVVLAKRLIEEGRIFLLDQTEETGE